MTGQISRKPSNVKKIPPSKKKEPQTFELSREGQMSARVFVRSDFYCPDEVKRFEPHHVVFARFGTDWYGVAATTGIGQVLIGEGQKPLPDPELTFKFYRDHAGKELRQKVEKVR